MIGLEEETVRRKQFPRFQTCLNDWSQRRDGQAKTISRFQTCLNDWSRRRRDGQRKQFPLSNLPYRLVSKNNFPAFCKKKRRSGEKQFPEEERRSGENFQTCLNDWSRRRDGQAKTISRFQTCLNDWSRRRDGPRRRQRSGKTISAFKPALTIGLEEETVRRKQFPLSNLPYRLVSKKRRSGETIPAFKPALTIGLEEETVRRKQFPAFKPALTIGQRRDGQAKTISAFKPALTIGLEERRSGENNFPLSNLLDLP
ncbi:unnamed protein product [Acanthosepion pharaonis]|uniref:Uncharacterized protein n=1 Tax=Acanthosepion pharaonis TaxID=158019 RepID=A0A812BML5_ACAPH|nr:unnamed protein product [Sepia pharaonis]